MSTIEQAYIDEIVAPMPDAGAVPEAESGPQPLFTREEAEAQGFSPEEIFALDRAGLIAKPDWKPWRPETLADVEWIARRITEYDAEIALRQERHLRAVQRLTQLRETFRGRFAALCAEVVTANLPRKTDGTLAKKSVPGELLDLGVRTVPSRPELVEPEKLVRFLYRLPRQAQGWNDLAAAVTVIRRQSELDPAHAVSLAVAHYDGALEPHAAEGVTYEVKLNKKVLADVAKRLQDVDGETGEAKRADLPGVEWSEAREEWWFK